jgi:2-dehydro-3-deoxygalactonokinase
MICIDGGSTNTRVCLVHKNQILASEHLAVGARDTARDGSPERLHQALLSALASVRQAVPDAAPSLIAASGMITSALGLFEVPHVEAPAGVTELAQAAVWREFPSITKIPVLLVPGVRTGRFPCQRDTVQSVDIMRGEETVCLGLVAGRRMPLPCTVLHLGSHWKAIRLAAHGSIDRSTTSLTGELVHVTQTQTILASAVPTEPVAKLDDDWLLAGLSESRRSGVTRALFSVRLLEQSRLGTPNERLAYLLGAYLAVDLDAWLEQGWFDPHQTLIVAGQATLAAAAASALGRLNLDAVCLTAAETQAAWLAGLRAIVAAWYLKEDSIR